METLNDAQEGMRMLVEMRANLSWIPFGGGYWTVDGVGIRASGEAGEDEPLSVIAAAYLKWLDAGAKRREPYTDEQARAATARVEQYHEEIADEIIAKRNGGGPCVST